MNVNTGIKQALVLAFGIIARQGELLEKGIAIVDRGQGFQYTLYQEGKGSDHGHVFVEGLI